MNVCDLSSKVESEVREARHGADVSCMHYDDQTGFIWTGHRNGGIRWDAARLPGCAPDAACAHACLSACLRKCFTLQARLSP